MIDVIIPAYNAHDTIETTLYSIAYQDIVDKLNVYIVDDCSEIGYQKYVDFFSNFMNIKEIRLDENVGPGKARQVGIDNSSSEYIIFIDSDDTFYDCLSIKKLYDAICDGADLVISTFFEEVDNELYEKNRDSVWLHGKIYRRNFLDKHKIKFNDSRQNEDNGFNQLILLCGANVSYIDDQTYIWRTNMNSITRKNNYEYEFKGIYGYIYNIAWALEEANKRDVNKIYLSVLAYTALIAVYYYYLEFNDRKGVEDFIKLSKGIKKHYNPSLLNKENILSIVKNQFNYAVNDDNVLKILDPVITFSQFLNRIEDEILC